MGRVLRVGLLVAAGVVTVGALGGGFYAQAPAPAGPWMAVTPVNDAPNPYNTIEGSAKLPEGRTWGSTSAVDIDKDGKSFWVAERCQVNTCWDAAKGEMSPLNTVFKFDATGKMVASFGQGMFVFPHGIHVDRDGNIWVADGNGNRPTRRPGQAGGNPPGADAADPASFYQPNDVITYPNGDILVAEGHGGANSRLIKFDKSGKFLMQYGKKGTGLEGEFDQPHSLAFDAKGRLFVADRTNNRIQILDAATLKTLDTWYQFSRLSGIFIDKNDMIYGADSESGSVNPAHGKWLRGIRIGSAKDGKVIAFIPDPSNTDATAKGTLAAEGVAADRDGVIYGAEVGPRKLQRYVKK